METTNTVPSASRSSAYLSAGVDIDSKMSGIRSIKKMVASTATAGSIGGIGNFGGLFSSPGKDHLLVASTDGVGTKLKVAVMAKRHNTVGQDLVNHCVNDILVQGAEPLFFLDYLGASRFDGAVFQEVIAGLCKACKENSCALLGGETAEMPGLYPSDEYDLVGTIVGAVPKRKMITGNKILAGDVIIGLASGGLQTNGYSLARKVIFDQCGLTPNDLVPGTHDSVADTLLAVHRSFLHPVRSVMATVPINGMAHITGGGFADNIPRVLPDKCKAFVNRLSWTPPTIFTFIERQGRIDHDEMYRVFNMGIGFVIIVRPRAVKTVLGILSRFRTSPTVIGVIESGKRGVIYRDRTV
jgi:phosphoribosylformylglycinamidine cyclo-ligase